MTNSGMNRLQGSTLPHRRAAWRVPRLGLLLYLLTACNGRPVTVGPDYGTAAPETPGLVTPQEQQYMQQAHDYISYLVPDIPEGVGVRFSVDLFDDRLVGLQNAQYTPVPDWQSRAKPVLTELETRWSQAGALPVPLRLQAINEHYQNLLTHYRKVLDLHQQEIVPGQPFPVIGDREANDWQYVTLEKYRFTELLTGFKQRHP